MRWGEVTDRITVFGGSNWRTMLSSRNSGSRVWGFSCYSASARHRSASIWGQLRPSGVFLPRLDGLDLSALSFAIGWLLSIDYLPYLSVDYQASLNNWYNSTGTDKCYPAVIPHYGDWTAAQDSAFLPCKTTSMNEDSAHALYSLPIRQQRRTLSFTQWGASDLSKVVHTLPRYFPASTISPSRGLLAFSGPEGYP